MLNLKESWTKLSFLGRLRLFLGAFLLLLILVLLYFKVIPSGHITYQRDWPAGWHSGKGFIYDFKPAVRFTDDGQSLKITADPVYFSLFTPRRFDQAQVTVTYRNQLSAATPIVEIGVLQDKVSGSYELQPLENDIVDALRSSWPHLQDDGTRLVLQADKYYSSLADFDADLAAGRLRDCPGGPTSCVAVYNYSLPSTYRLPDYIRSVPLTISQPLRGSHQFYVYFQAAPWRLHFSFTDLNQDPAPDPVTVNVYDGDQVIASQSLADPNLNPTGGQTESKEMTLSGTAPHAGVYKVAVGISDDVVIASIQSSSDRLAFINNIWPVSGAGAGALTLFTDAGYLQAQTSDPANLGPINFGGQTFNLDAPYRQFTFSAGSGIKEIDLAKDDVALANNGMFAFSRASLFNPAPVKVDRFFPTSDNDIRYIVAAYARPSEFDGWKTASAAFPISAADRTDGKYTFLISVPGLDGAAATGTAPTMVGAAANFLEIKSIRVELSGKTLWQKIWPW